MVLILPTVRHGIWSLFNIGSPNYYVAPSCLQNMLQTTSHRDWLLGRISSITTMRSAGKESNPYRLPEGIVYREIEAYQEHDGLGENNSGI